MSTPTRNRGRGRKVNRRQRSGARREGGGVDRLRHRVPASLGRRVRAVLTTGRRLALPAVLGAAAVTLIWVATHYVTTGPYFRLRTAEVQGLHRLTDQDVLKAIDLRMQVSSTLGLDLEGLAAGLRAHPWIADAEVERWLPEQLTIRITERVPEAVVVASADPDATEVAAPMLADAYGRRFARAERPADLDLPAITGVDLPDVGDHAAGVSEGRLKTALAALREWRRQGLDALDDLSEVHVDRTASLTLYTQRDGTAIRLGRRQLAARLARVRSVLSDIHARGERAEYVLADDSRDGARVVVRTAQRTQPSEASASPVAPKQKGHGHDTQG